MEWREGQNYFCEDEFDSVGVVTDRRGVRIEVGVKKGGLLLKTVIRGSRSPYPITTPPEKIPPRKVIGAIAVSISHIGTVEVTCPLEGGGLKDFWDWLSDIPDPSGDEPPLVKVARPWPEFNPEFLAWSPLCGDGLVYDPQIIDERQLDEVRAVMAADGIAVTRDFAWGTVGPGDPTNGRRLLPWLPDWNWNEAYWAQLDRRLGQWCLRDGTYVISVLDACSFYAGSSFETNPLKPLLGDRPQDVFLPGPARTKVYEYAMELFRRTRKYHPRVIIQTRNEGSQLTGPDNLYEYDHALITLLKQAGMPVENIMIGYYDSSMCAKTLLPETWMDPDTGEVHHGVDLMGRGLADAHNIGSPECILDSGSEARRMMSWGAFPSCDGSDREGKAAGLGWYWLQPGVALRPTAAQAKRIVQIMSDFGYPRFEYWSSVAFQDGYFPNLAAAKDRGHEERVAMREGID
jgi:hypothetical protein